MTKAILGVIGGSGVYDLPGLDDVREERIDSPWGEPSDVLRIGRLGDTTVVFLPRHGRGHRLSPTDINYRANIDVLKRAGVTDLVSVSACGSFKEELAPGTFVLVDQFVDRTVRRETSFFGAGCVAHVSMAHPVGPLLQARIAAAAAAEGIAVHRGGTYVCMEGPQFSSRSESLAYKAAGYEVIGMTNLPEAKLAREAEITYATIAMVTDYDCWHPAHEAVEVSDVIAVVKANAGNAARLVARLARDFPAEHEPCPAKSDRALEFAIMTAPEARDPALMAKLDAVAGRVLGTAAVYRSAAMSHPVHPATRIGHVHLKVADLDRAIAFYCGVLGFGLMQRFGSQAAFVSAGGYHHHIGLNTWESAGGPPPAPGTTGLYHLAILYPDRAQLGDALRRLDAAGMALDGASDHGVSEALYLRDPDGNGVELYHDRPRAEWPRSPAGELAMITRRLDLAALRAA